MTAQNSSHSSIHVNAHRDEKHFIVRADEKLTAFLELEACRERKVLYRRGR
jgi:hypothetical protein